MSRQIFVYFIAFGLLFLLGEYMHNFFLGEEKSNLGFSLEKMYAFHAFFSLQLCVVFNILSKNEKMSPQLGFIYLASFILKIGVFAALFHDPLLTAEKLSRIQQISMLIPMFLFLLLEVYFIVKILNKNHSPK